jgi:hypothetical protein
MMLRDDTQRPQLIREVAASAMLIVAVLIDDEADPLIVVGVWPPARPGYALLNSSFRDGV